DVDAPRARASFYLAQFEIRQADRSHFALLHKFVERLHRLFERRDSIGPVDEVDVDVIGVERLEAFVDRLDHALAGAVAIVGSVGIADAELGRDDGFLAPRAERFRQRFFRRAEAVRLGGIEAVDAEIERAINRFDELGFLDTAVAAANLPASEAHGGNLNTGPAKWSEFHTLPPHTDRSSVTLVPNEFFFNEGTPRRLD